LSCFETGGVAVKAFRSLRTLQLVTGSALLLLVVVTGVAGTAGLVLSERWTAEARRIEQLLQVAEAARGDLYRQTKEVFDFHFLADPDARGQYAAYGERIAGKVDDLGALAATAEERAAVARLTEAYAEARTNADAIMARDSGAFSEAEKLALFDTEFEAASLSAVEAAFDAAEEVFLVAKRDLERRVERVTNLALLVVVVPIGVAGALLLFARSFLQRAFVEPLSDLLRAMAAYGAGRFDHRVEERGAAEMVTLQRAISRMADEVATSRAAMVRAEKQAALGALVPVVAHNIRNPLASIRATAQVLAEATGQELHEGVRSILAAVDRLNGWLGALLSYLDPLRANRTTATLAGCADHALALLAPRLEEKALAVAREGWQSSGTAALDTDLMEQALYGLIANAVEASPRGARLRLEAGAGAGASWLAIEDEGPGLPFEPNPHAVPGPSTKAYGSGLGIPFAYKICDLHDGELRFARAAGGGARVVLSVPLSVA
jgi:signal transduction histidine kinase